MEALGQLIQELEKRPRWRTQGQLRQILACWSAVVGPSVAQHTVPVKLSRQVLHVAVSNGTWAQTLMFERLRILEKLNAHLSSGLEDIRFSPGDWWRRPQRPQPAASLQAALQSHPCYSPSVGAQGKIRTDSLEMAFQWWTEYHRRWACQQPLCPDCRCHCPMGELQRWQKCSICAAKQMRS